MTQISLPNQSVTGANLWSQVEDNDQAIINVVNGDLDDSNIATGADIDGAKLLAASVDTTQLAADAVTGAKIEDDAVDTEHIADDAVENAQIADDAVDTAQIADDAVDTAQIADDAVTFTKINTNNDSDTTNTYTTYSGTSANGSDIGGLEITVPSGQTWFIVAHLTITTHNGLLAQARLRAIDTAIFFANSPIELATATFEGEGRSDYTMSITIPHIYSNTGLVARDIVVRLGSSAGGSVDLEVPSDSCSLHGFRIA